MEFGCLSPLRMALVILGLLMLVELPSNFVSGSVIQLRVCGADRLSYSKSLDRELFHINGNEVNKVSFCKSLELYHANGCFFDLDLEEWRGLGRNCCGLDLYSVELPQRAGRKLLRELGTNESSLSQKVHSREENHDHSSFSAPKTITVSVSGMFLLCCSYLCPCFRSRTKESTRPVLDPSSMDSASSLELSSASEKIPPSPLRVPPSPRFLMSPKLHRLGSVHLDMNQVIRATHNFSPSRQIGEGGFGTIYKAQLQDGQVVAIKRAKKVHLENKQTEFSSEIGLLAKIEHRNLVKLLGYVEKGNERIIITEYVPNGTLREHLDGQHGKILDFNQRLEICIDVAHGLTYLHSYAEKQIIHRDVKASNILLTESFRAKVADFGFARLGPMEDNQTHILTKVKGTVGYLDPEYLRTYQLTPKSDVFSFGILLVEILTGRRPVESRRAIEEKVTVRWAFNKYNEGNVMQLLDPKLEEVVPVEILMKMFNLAFQCAAPTRSDRPDMKEVGEELWRIRMDHVKSAKEG